MTSSEIRQSFLDFFKSKQHTIVPSSSLLPDSPNLLFTNAGMNQFVPIFLGQQKPEVDKWPGAIPGLPTRAADTQKCIRAGGKHNDLDDVGLDTYHLTFFEMLGNWSFGDYFKRESLTWGWELLTKVWGISSKRLFATVYAPDKSKGDPSEFDQEASEIWTEIFRKEGLDPTVHIVHGNKKDNFWMMGETGPCGPCSEIHFNLLPSDDEAAGRALVNAGSQRCIEIWNHVFIQFNANPDNTYSPLPARHVDTGMGFDRIAGFYAGTKGFKEFSELPSAYNTDIFTALFAELENLCGKKYTATLPKPGSTGDTDQERIDIAFRVIADHIRTLSFAIADGIQPGNTDRNYVLRRILRRAVRYGRTLGFHEPFFYKLGDVLAETMGDIFPEIRAKKKHVQEVIRTEEEAFNKTLDNGIALFHEEVAKLLGSALTPGATDRALGGGTGASDNRGAKYAKRRLPHFERPWGKYMVTFSTREKRQLTPAERDIVLASILYAHEHGQYQLYAACVMPDHAHILFEPQIKGQDKEGKPVFFSLGEIIHGIKSTTAHRINKAAEVTGVHVWEEESFDRLLRGDSDLEEKFHYICRNPWDNSVIPVTENYRWLWTPEAAGITPAPGVTDRALAVGSETAAGKTTLPDSARPTVSRGARETTPEAGALPEVSRGARETAPGAGALPEVSRGARETAPEAGALPEVSREGAGNGARGGRAPQISGQFAFRLYDEQGFPLDLTELMARERGLTVDKEGFRRLMEEQRARARAAQKKEVIAVEERHDIHTQFVGFEQLESEAMLETFVTVGGSNTGAGAKTFAVVNVSPLYAEMGGQVGDTGWLYRGDNPNPIPVLNTIKRGDAFYLQVDLGTETMPGSSFPTPVEMLGERVRLRLVVDKPRRNAIQRHHTVTHLLHWALHEVVSHEASQKGSFVGPDKLTFDFNSGPLTPQQVADIEELVNERILENAGVSWTEVPYPDVKNRKDVMQFFGDKYGDIVRVVQIGGHAAKLDGYSMELCGGTHTRATGEIGLFRIVGESAIAAGVRRIEAVAGLEAYRKSADEVALIKTLAGKVNSPVHELDKKIEALLEHQKQLEKALTIAQQKEAANTAKALLAKVQSIEPAVSQPPLRAIIENLGVADGDYLQAVADALKGQFKGVIVLGGVNNGAVALLASVSPEFTAKVQAGKIIQSIAPIVGGKGGGKPDNARGGGKDAAKLDEALAKARALMADA